MRSPSGVRRLQTYHQNQNNPRPDPNPNCQRAKLKGGLEVQHGSDTGSGEHKDKLISLTSEPPYLLNCEARVHTAVCLVVEAYHTLVK